MKKLRRFYTPEQLKEIYRHRYEPDRWAEHTTRIRSTIFTARALITTHELKTVTDLSAGNGAITDGLVDLVTRTTARDITQGYLIDATVETMEPTDLFICTETIEHLEAPWTMLEKAATKSRFILLSTPDDEDPAIGNHEHYWSFTEEDVASMLTQAGFVDGLCHLLMDQTWTYSYQIWTARSAAYVAA